MKKILTILLCTAAVSLAGGCKKDSEGRSKTTYYATITLSGSSEVIVDKGSTYKEPGYYAEMNGEDITDQVKVISNVNEAESGVYSVIYSAVNEDGFSSSVTRTVYVFDAKDPMEGLYITDEVSANGSTKYSGPWTSVILALGNNQYSTSDYFAGWYDQGRAYGPNYAMTGTLEVNSGKVTYIDSYIAGWGDCLDNKKGDDIGTFSSATGIFEWTVSYAGSMTFKVKTTKVK